MGYSKELEMTKPSVAIVGAGMAGIACGCALKEAGYAPVIFEKSRGAGGRMATRRTADDLQFDHGAQYLTARSDGFKRFIRKAVSTGSVVNWQAANKSIFVGNPTMNAIVKAAAEGLEVRANEKIEMLNTIDGQWTLSSENPLDTFDIGVLTMPAPQIIELLGEQHSLSREIADVCMAPCLTVLAAFPPHQPVPFVSRRIPNDPLAWIAQDSSKPGRPRSKTCWVAQASPDWSAEHLECRPEEIVSLMLPMLCEALGTDPEMATHVSAHRWRYALVTAPLGRPFVCDDSASLYLGGDWTLGARVEAAWQSGSAIAADILARNGT